LEGLNRADAGAEVVAHDQSQFLVDFRPGEGGCCGGGVDVDRRVMDGVDVGAGFVADQVGNDFATGHGKFGLLNGNVARVVDHAALEGHGGAADEGAGDDGEFGYGFHDAAFPCQV